MTEQRCCLNCGDHIETTRSNRRKLYCGAKCRAYVQSRKWRLANPDKIRKQRLRENSYVSKRMWTRSKSRAKKFDITFDITPDDIIVPQTCPVLGIELYVADGQGSGYHYNSPSLDRIHPEKGYTKGNVRVISARANLLKSNASIKELEAILSDLQTIHENSGG